MRNPTQLLQLEVAIAFTHGSWVAPEPTYNATGITIEGRIACTASFMVPPTHDRIYIATLETKEPYRKQGYATSILIELVRYFEVIHGRRMPITPIHVTETAWGFWEKIRHKNIPELSITTDIDSSEMDIEASRWKIITFR